MSTTTNEYNTRKYPQRQDYDECSNDDEGEDVTQQQTLLLSRGRHANNSPSSSSQQQQQQQQQDHHHHEPTTNATTTTTAAERPECELSPLSRNSSSSSVTTGGYDCDAEENQEHDDDDYNDDEDDEDDYEDKSATGYDCSSAKSSILPSYGSSMSANSSIISALSNSVTSSNCNTSVGSSSNSHHHRHLKKHTPSEEYIMTYQQHRILNLNQVSSSSRNGSGKAEQQQQQQGAVALESSLQILHRKKRRASINRVPMVHHHAATSKRLRSRCDAAEEEEEEEEDCKLPAAHTSTSAIQDYANPMYSIDSNVMAHILSYLAVSGVHTFLTAPLSREFRMRFTKSADLWRVLCISDPFGAILPELHDDACSSSSSSSSSSLPSSSSASCVHGRARASSATASYSDHQLDSMRVFGKYRLMYASFVRCMEYLDGIVRESSASGAGKDASSRRSGGGGNGTNNNANLGRVAAPSSRISTDEDDDGNGNGKLAKIANMRAPSKLTSNLFLSSTKVIGRGGNGKSVVSSSSNTARSSISIGHVDLPWTCAIYSVINWMVAFADVRGIQTQCLKVLPLLLEDEGQRTIGQRSGLTDIILRGMLLFPNCVELHSAALHCIVLLARPLGGREGQPYSYSQAGNNNGSAAGGNGGGVSVMNNGYSGIFNSSSKTCSINGIAVVLDSMRRFTDEEALQAMGCWSMVNIALIPAQKTMLLKLGGISVSLNAMMRHPHSASVQFRAIFALINLVIATDYDAHNNNGGLNGNMQQPAANAANAGASANANNNLNLWPALSEKELIDESASQITNLIVVAMKNFCHCSAILNRACLVLHNLSLFDEYLPILLHTPNCYQMLEWSMANFAEDSTLQQSASRTLQRLQALLGSDEALRRRFMASLTQTTSSHNRN
eukprot:CAMPEP_0196806954 /NCGR_PEP_ID=MMETSP1362-20130617/6882_1 /TAXON_ID=163516 /ORGANISM="Leptocylindrus danicus, Strain CCMP1856" /LENGTH=898 /DNA_ID=CAMNT_0042180655 /DNA_START=544 /DNA_END=3240 /DNA_ORIENTATION=+